MLTQLKVEDNGEEAWSILRLWLSASASHSKGFMFLINSIIIAERICVAIMNRCNYLGQNINSQAFKCFFYGKMWWCQYLLSIYELVQFSFQEAKKTPNISNGDCLTIPLKQGSWFIITLSLCCQCQGRWYLMLGLLPAHSWDQWTVISAVHSPTSHKKLPIVFSSCSLTLFTSADAHSQVQSLYCMFELLKISSTVYVEKNIFICIQV